MAPFAEASVVTYSRTLEDGTKVYVGVTDPDWVIGSITYGGYSVALALNALIDVQSNGPHPDPIYLSTQFIRAVTPGPYEIHVRKVRGGKQFDNFVAEFYQKKKSLMFMCQLIFGDMSPPKTPHPLTLPRKFQPLCPLITHPSKSVLGTPHWALKYGSRHEFREDPAILAKNDGMNAGGRTADGLTWGSWMKLNPGEVQTCGPSTIPFFADHCIPPWILMPGVERQDHHWWHPTLSYTIEFKHKLPLPSEYAQTTLGVFGWKRHMAEGRWSDTVEIWSAPAEELNSVDDSWREKMICVAVASQTAGSTPMDDNITRYTLDPKDDTKAPRKRTHIEEPVMELARL